MWQRSRPLACAGLLLLGLAGCTRFGAMQVPTDQFDYNKAIARSMQEQMLLNIVRLRYFEAPVFLTVSSVLTQYSWAGTVGVTGQEGFGIGGGLQAPGFVSGSAAAQYLERPTITYLPIEGDDFARRLMTPMPLDFVFALREAGYATDILFRSGISRMNDVHNMGGVGIPLPGDVDRTLQARRERDNLARFQRLVSVILELSLLNAVEVQRRTGEDGPERVLVIAPRQTPETAALVRELKTILELDPNASVFRLTTRRVGRAPDEITVQTRSLIQIMAFLAQGVEVPPERRREVALDAELAAPADGAERLVPLRVRWSAERPVGAFVAAEHLGGWYAIDADDIQSKRAFNLLVYGFRLLAPERAATAPVLTLPTGP